MNDFVPQFTITRYPPSFFLLWDPLQAEYLSVHCRCAIIGCSNAVTPGGIRCPENMEHYDTYLKIGAPPYALQNFQLLYLILFTRVAITVVDGVAGDMLYQRHPCTDHGVNMHTCTSTCQSPISTALSFPPHHPGLPFRDRGDSTTPPSFLSTLVSDGVSLVYNDLTLRGLDVRDGTPYSHTFTVYDISTPAIVAILSRTLTDTHDARALAFHDQHYDQVFDTYRCYMGVISTLAKASQWHGATSTVQFIAMKKAERYAREEREKAVASLHALVTSYKRQQGLLTQQIRVLEKQLANDSGGSSNTGNRLPDQLCEKDGDLHGSPSPQTSIIEQINQLKTQLDGIKAEYDMHVSMLHGRIGGGGSNGDCVDSHTTQSHPSQGESGSHDDKKEMGSKRNHHGDDGDNDDDGDEDDDDDDDQISGDDDADGDEDPSIACHSRWLVNAVQWSSTPFLPPTCSPAYQQQCHPSPHALSSIIPLAHRVNLVANHRQSPILGCSITNQLADEAFPITTFESFGGSVRLCETLYKRFVLASFTPPVYVAAQRAHQVTINSLTTPPNAQGNHIAGIETMEDAVDTSTTQERQQYSTAFKSNLQHQLKDKHHHTNDNCGDDGTNTCQHQSNAPLLPHISYFTIEFDSALSVIGSYAKAASISGTTASSTTTERNTFDLQNLYMD